MSNLARLSDETLEAAIVAARELAHSSPMGEYNLHADGTKEIRNPTRAWAKDAEEWVRLCDERDRRARVRS